jgi:hypothetical protein
LLLPLLLLPLLLLPLLLLPLLLLLLLLLWFLTCRRCHQHLVSLLQAAQNSCSRRYLHDHSRLHRPGCLLQVLPLVAAPAAAVPAAVQVHCSPCLMSVAEGHGM